MTKHTVDFVPTADPLLRHPVLTQSVGLSILGIEVEVETNSVYVRDLFEETFNGWAGRNEENPASASADRVHVRIIVHGGNESTNADTPVRYVSTDDGRLIVQSPGSVAIVDPSRRESLAYVTTALAADREHFRTSLVEAITFALLACFDRHPVHAAAIAADGRAVLLAGPSGMGKSTLAYLAHAAGIQVLGEDRVWVQMEPELRIWGAPATARLTAESLSLFPELCDAAGAARGNGGGGKVAVSLTSNDRVGPASRAVVCVLARGDRAALDRMSHANLSTTLSAQLAPGFDRFPDRIDRVIDALTANGGWRLTLTNDARDALPFLRRMLEEG